MEKRFKNYLVDDILKNKLIVISSLLIAVMSFGFAVTNFSIGVDDTASYHYLHTFGWGNMLQQGRLLHILFDRVTGYLEFIPFLNEFIGACLFWLSAIFFCALFQYVTNGKLNNFVLAVFCGIYISFPITAEKFIYSLDVIVTMLSYVCVAYSLAKAYEAIYLKKKISFLISVIFLIIGIGAYESFIFLYISGVFAIFLLKCIFSESKVKLTDTILKGFGFLAILLIAFSVYYAAVYISQLAMHQYGIFARDSVWSYEHLTFIEKIVRVLVKLKTAFLSASNVAIVEFDIFAVICAVISLVFSIKKKSLVPLLCFGGLIAANLGIHIIIGYFMLRSAQTMCFFVAFTAMLLTLFLSKIKIKASQPIITGIVCLLVFIQLAELNLAFYDDYARYKKEEFVVHSIATRLVAECDVTKPVVFVNRGSGYLNTVADDRQAIGMSLMHWSVGAFGDVQSSVMLECFKLHGYDFLVKPDKETAAEALSHAAEMEGWPKQGCIKEFDEYILVSIGEPAE
ncbi:MAG: glucosyltransferase domain-containing protein [Candidatus Fimenecus sp.]